MNTVELFIPSPNGQLFARAVIPESPRKTPTGKTALMLISHGLLDNIEAPVHRHLQGLLAKLSLASLAFDFHGNGNSTGATTYGNYYAEADDMAAVVTHLHCKGVQNSNVQVIGTLGHSKGASSMLLFAYKYMHLCPPLLITLSPRFWLAREITMRWTDENKQQLQENGKFLWRRYGKKPTKSNGDKISEGESGLVKEYWISLSDMSERAGTDMSVVQALPLHRCYVLNIMGSKDQIVPDEDVWEYDRLMRLSAPSYDRVVTRIVPGAAHFWNKRRELAGLERTLTPWLTSTLSKLNII